MKAALKNCCRKIQLKGWLRDLLVILSIMIPIRSSIADWYQVPTGSMKPTILEGDRVAVNKLAYDLKVPLTKWRLAQWSDPRRGDIVVTYSPADGMRLVKRVVAIPGDQIALKNNHLWINGIQANYAPLESSISSQVSKADQGQMQFARETLGGESRAIALLPDRPARRNFGLVTVPAGFYFIMGDNRDNSLDSRYFGFVKRRDIIGKAWAVAASFDPDQYYLPRMKRWLRSLH